MSTTYREPITFNDIQKGDRLRVRYTDGGQERTTRMTNLPHMSVSVTRTVVAEVEAKALDMVWLNRKGHAIVHRDWDDLEIVRLSKVEPEPVTVRSGEVWTAKELEALTDWDVPATMMAARLGRTVAAVNVRRSMLRKQFNKQVTKNRLARSS